MKIRCNLLIAFSLIFSISSFKGQINGSELRNKVLLSVNDINLENKILFVNVWKSDNPESRENNREFARVSKIYEQAKLKNGLKGVSYINISLDDPAMWRIALKKDSIDTKFSLENSNGEYNSLVELFNSKPGNVVVGNDGEILGTNIKKEDCFILFRSLITR
jgi:hypothetical protein